MWTNHEYVLCSSVLLLATYVFVFFYHFYIKLLQSVNRIIQILLTIPQVIIDSGQVVQLLLPLLHHDPLPIPIVPTPDHISIILCHTAHLNDVFLYLTKGEICCMAHFYPSQEMSKSQSKNLSHH